MSVNIQIRDVPDEVRDRIAAHATDRGVVLCRGYLLGMLDQVAARPTRADWDALATLRAQAPDEGLNEGEYPR